MFSPNDEFCMKIKRNYYLRQLVSKKTVGVLNTTFLNKRSHPFKFFFEKMASFFHIFPAYFFSAFKYAFQVVSTRVSTSLYFGSQPKSSLAFLLVA